MAWTSGFFNSINNDRLYTADQMSAIFTGLITDGVFMSVGNRLAVEPNSGMTIQINTGRGWFGGKWADNDSPYLITLESSDVTLNRYAGIFVKSDINDSSRKAEPYVKYSDFASAPVKPSVERTELVKEYCLAYVLIRAGASSITAADIEDSRADTNVCGWVTGIIDQVDSKTLWEQWDAEFNLWFDEMKDQLSEDAAGNLQIQIDEVRETAEDALEIASVINLLDNSDFTNPINDNGAMSYTGSKETITKWVSRSGYSVVTVNEDCVNIKSSNGTTAAYVLQFLDTGKIKSGKKYTVACELKDGSIHCITAEASTSMTEVTRYIYVNGAQLGTIRFRYDSTEAKYAVMFSTLSTSGIDIVNVALYEGEYTNEDLPIYKSKGYGVEVVNCYSGGNAKLLWTNANLTSSFTPQTVSLNLNAYNYVEIEYKESTTSEVRCIEKIAKGNGARTVIQHNQRNIRRADVTETDIVFSEGWQGAVGSNVSAKNESCLPIRIWGVK